MKYKIANIFKSTRAAGIEVVFLPEKGFFINIALIKVNAGNLSVENIQTTLQKNFAKLQQQHDEKILISKLNRGFTDAISGISFLNPAARSSAPGLGGI